MRRRLVTAALCALLPAPAFAFTLLDQEREVAVAIERRTLVCPIDFQFPICPFGPPSQTKIENFSDSEAATDLSDFSATASVADFPSSHATLTSSAGASSLAAHGTRSAFAQFGGSFSLPNGTITNIYHTHDTYSRYEMSFELTQPTGYTLNGSLHVIASWFTPGDEVSSLVLTGPAGVVSSLDLDGARDCEFSAEVLDCVLEDSVAQSGILAPGVYTLSASTSGGAGPVYRYDDSASGSFDVSLALNAPVVPGLPTPALPLLAALLAGIGSSRLRRAPIRSAWRIERCLRSRSS